MEDEYKQEFSCPFCAEEFDIVGLYIHIEEEHQMELKQGVIKLFHFTLELVTISQSLMFIWSVMFHVCVFAYCDTLIVDMVV